MKKQGNGTLTPIHSRCFAGAGMSTPRLLAKEYLRRSSLAFDVTLIRKTILKTFQ